jgi:DNA primase
LISPQTTERIKQAARIDDVVGEFVPMKKRGANLLGLCPFHQEKTPSFTVNIARNTYKCFGCGRGGDSISFLEEHEHLSYPEALRWLANRYQIEIEEEHATPEQQAAHDHNESLMIVTQYAAKWFAGQLHESEEGQSIGLSYFQERGFRKETLEHFGLGWCPENSDSFTQAALAAGYRQEYLEELGLTKSKEGRSWDFYRARVIFPIHNLSGKTIAFGARTLRTGPGIPKYLNSPESPIYSKSAVLYGIFQARRAISEANLAYMVEGYTDVISLHQAGIKNVVASSGTALTAAQLRLVRRYTPNITLLYDGDSAGLKAAMRGTEIALEEGLNVRIVRLPDADDPDSLVQRLGGDGTREFLEREAKDFVLFKTSMLLEEAEGDPIRKAELVRDVLGTISKVSDSITRSLYLKQTAALMEIKEELLIQETNRLVQQQHKRSGPPSVKSEPDLPSQPLESSDSRETSGDPVEYRERDLIRLLFEADGYTIDERSAVSFILEHISEVELVHPVYSDVLTDYRTGLENGVERKSRYFLEHERKDFKDLAISLLHPPYELSPNWGEKHEIAITDKKFLIRKDIEKVVASLKASKIDRMLQELQIQIKETEEPAEVMHLMMLYKELRDARAALTNAAGHLMVNKK